MKKMYGDDAAREQEPSIQQQIEMDILRDAARQRDDREMELKDIERGVTWPQTR